MDKANIFFTSYNDVVKSAYEKAVRESKKAVNKSLHFDGDPFEKYINEAVKRWESEPMKELGDISPERFMQSVETLDELLAMFDIAPVICDYEVPEIFTEGLRSFGSDAIDALSTIADRLGIVDKDEDEEILPVLLVIKLLGKWQTAAAVPALIGFLDKQGANYDLFAEEVKSALIAIGEPAIEPVIKAIETRDINGPAVEYLLMTLSEAGADNKSEEIFKCLKNAFRSKDNKAFTAICLMEYGDGRAVPALRGYLERNGDKLSRDDYYEFVSAITELGGNTEGFY